MSAGTWAVVVNWNGGDGNLECLRSLIGEGLEAGHVVFVDNASSDGSLERTTAEFPSIVTLRNTENRGYGHATNQGVEHALKNGAEFVFLVNNDLTIAEGTLQTLLEALRSSETVGIVGPRIVFKNEPDVIWSAGGRMTYRQNLSTMIGHKQPDGPQYRRVFDVDYVAGAAMLVRRAVFADVGLLDGEYFAYHEDIEFCMKAREGGFRVQTVGTALAWHDAHSSTGGGYNVRRKYMMGVNTIWFLRRHGTPGRWLSFFVFDVLTLPIVWIARALRGEGDAVWSKARGMLDGLRGRRVTKETVRVVGKGSS